MSLINQKRREVCTAVLGLLLLSACDENPNTVTLDVVLYSYLDRPIINVVVGQRDVGNADAYPRSGRDVMIGVEFTLGPQNITWRLDGSDDMPRNGEMITAKNIPELKDVPRIARFLAIHIYPDDTVEFVYTEYFPGLSKRGEEFHVEWKKKHGN